VHESIFFQKDGLAMKPHSTLTNRMLDAIAQAPGCRIEELADLFPEITMKEIFYTLGYLSRNGDLRLIVDRQGSFAVTTSLRAFN